MKALIAPLPLALGGFLVASILLYYRSRTRLAIATFFSSWMFLYLFSTPFMTSLILLSLGKGSPLDYADECPEYVLIPSGGYIHGISAEHDVLHHFTSLRVAAAASRFKECEDTIFIMAGGSAPNRDSDHQAKLMAELAISRGVHPDKIIYESLSKNTREHVIELLKLDGVSTDSRIVVVTSGWHVPRTRDVFAPAFANVSYHPVWQARAPLQITHFVPTTFALVENNILVTEWFGRIWYAVR